MGSEQQIPGAVNEGADVGFIVEEAMIANAVRLLFQVVQRQKDYIHPGDNTQVYIILLMPQLMLKIVIVFVKLNV